MPRLLVSVRSSAEALAALEGGADILDVKEPARGSLGMADVGTIREVLGTARIMALAANAQRSAQTPPVSAALGELRDWLGRRSVPALPPLAYAKLGLAGAMAERDWIARWVAVRRAFDRGTKGRSRWIAVAYADWRSAGAPPADAVIAAASETGCAGVLFDTFNKSAGGLFAHLGGEALAALVAQCRAASPPLLVAAGGGLTQADVPHIAGTGVDIIAIRTAACASGGRGGTVTKGAVARFRDAMAAACRSPAGRTL